MNTSISQQISEEEKQALIKLGMGEKIEHEPSETLVSLFRKQATKTPENVAVVFKDRQMTYRELDELTDRLAAHLISTYHVQPEEAVGVMIDRSELMAVYPLSIMKAGAAYMPLDFNFPEERLLCMCEDAEVRLMLSEDDRVRRAMPSFNGDVFTSDCLEELPKCSCQLPEPLPTHRFVILFTSGSTGKPKGVVLEHHNIVNLCHWYIKEVSITQEDRLLGFANFAFDMHMTDIYPALFTGASVCILDNSMRTDLEAMNNYMEKRGITIAFLTTQVGHLFATTIKNTSLRLLLVAGEKLPALKKPSYTVMNAYGPTETHISTFYNITQDYESAIIGKPIDNHQLFVVDRDMNLLPQGIVGELLIAGEGLSRGYLHPVEKDAARFLTFMGKRCYRTGDLVRWNEQGELEYLGRIDTQVKLRGFRIELGEIENQTLKYNGIKQAVANVSDGQLLCLYYTADCGIDEGALKDFLALSLPDYMVPAAYIHLDEVPLTPNGKVDRRRMPAPNVAEEDIVPPATLLEQQFFGLAAERLGTERFGVTSNLISLGLSSIAAMRLSITIHKETGFSLPVKAILSEPTIRQMAKAIEAGLNDGQDNLSDCHVLQEYYPLTENQRGVYIDWEMNRDTTQYNIPHVFRFKDMDAGQLAEALRKVIDAHGYIKTRFVIHEGEVMQQCRYEDPAKVSVTHLEQEPDTAFFQSRVRPFNPFEDDLYRLEVYACGDDTWLFKDFHHLISDGLSEEVFYNDLLTAYKDGNVEKEDVNAFDVALYEQELKKSERYLEAQGYFDQLLEGTEAVSYPHSAHSDDIDKKSESLNLEITDGENIRNACRNMGITENAYFQTIVTQVLHCITREESIMLATISGGRHQNGMEHMIGMFVKTIPLVSTCDRKDDRTFADAARAMHRQGIESVSRDFYPLTKVVERHGLRPQILYAYQGGLYDGVNLDENDSVSDIPLTLDTQKLPIELYIWPNGRNGYAIELSYDTALFSRRDMEIFVQALVNYAIHATKVGTKLSDIQLTTEEEQTALIKLGTGKHLDIDINETFVSAFERQATETSERLAVVEGNSLLTYAELSQHSNLLAHLLIEAGVQSDGFVCILLHRVKEFPLSVIAIMKAGAAYLPMDTEYPAERLQYILEDSQARVLITSHDLLEEKQAQGMNLSEGIRVIFIDDVDFSEMAEPINLAAPDGLAYMIYTSGSTGRPKGVMLHHAGLRSYCISMADILSLTRSDRISLHRPFTFDAHIQDLFPPLTVGASVHIIPEAIRRDTEGIEGFIREHGITGGSYTTSLGALLLEGTPLPLRYMTLTGEKMTGLVSGDVQLFNGYGPTECTDLISTFRLEKGIVYDNIPIGRPMANSWCFITDQYGHLLPCGMAGELCFASVQVGRGYWQLPEQTAKVFGDCPFIEKDAWGRKVRMYHTGDLCRWNKQGELEYLGRIDNQVKLRGFRIELGEIESQTLKYDGIHQAVANVHDGQLLCLYYTADNDIDEATLKEFLAQSLPDYMVPAAYIQLEELPLTPNGKVDRKKLLVPEMHTQEQEYVAPKNEIETKIANCFAEALGMDKVSADADFFAIGGDSLSLMRLLVACRDLKLNFKLVYEGRTPVGIAKMIVGSSGSRRQTARKTHFFGPLHQLHYEWGNELEEGYGLHCDATIYLDKETDMGRLAAAIEKTLLAHPAVDARLTDVGNGTLRWKQGDLMGLKPSIEELSRQEYDALKPHLRQSLNKPETRMFVMHLFTIRESDGSISKAFYFDFLHPIIDGASIKIFLEDVDAAYRGEDLKPETFSIFDYYDEMETTIHTPAYEREQAWNREFVSSFTDHPCELPGDLDPKDENDTRDILVPIHADLAKVDAFTKKTSITDGTLLAAAYGLLQGVNNGEQAAVALTIYNARDDIRYERTLGAVYRHYPLCVRWNDDMPAEAFVKLTQENIMLCRRHALYEGEPVPLTAAFSYQGEDLDEFEFCGGKARYETIEDYEEEFFDFFMYRRADDFYCNLTYNTREYSDTFIERFLKNYTKTIHALVDGLNISDIIKKIEVGSE
jgi:amino acid adenylation domain-containing protein